MYQFYTPITPFCGMLLKVHVLVLVKVHLVNRSSSMTCSWLFKSWPPQNNWRFLGWRMLWHQPTWCLGGYFLGGILPQKWPKIEATVNDYSKIVIFSYFSAVCKKGFGGFLTFERPSSWLDEILVCVHTILRILGPQNRLYKENLSKQTLQYLYTIKTPGC